MNLNPNMLMRKSLTIIDSTISRLVGFKIQFVPRKHVKKSVMLVKVECIPRKYMIRFVNQEEAIVIQKKQERR